MSNTTQQALIIPSPKAPFVLGPRPIPVPGNGEVRLKLVAVGLNPVNYAQHQLGFLIPEYPAVIGADLAGVVDAVGEGVKGFAKGGEVFVQTMNGGFQQYTTVPAATLIRKPKNMSFDEVANFPITFTTACVGLFAQAPIGLGLNPSFSWEKPQQGESALIIGGGTSTGQFASAKHFDYLKGLGATECIDCGDVPLEKLVAKPPVKVVYDATGALDAAYDSVVDGGMVTTSRPQAKIEREPRGVTLVHCFGFYAGPDVMEPIGDPAHWHASGEHTIFGKRIIEELPKMLEKGVIVPNRIEILPNGLTEIPDALERMNAGGVSGVKLIAHPQESSA